MPGLLNSFWGAGGGGPLAVYISPVIDPIEKYDPDAYGSNNVTLYAIVSGGTPPYTYSWTRTSLPGGITAGITTASALLLSATGDGSPVDTDQETWQIEVTDDVAATATDSREVIFYFGLEPP